MSPRPNIFPALRHTNAPGGDRLVRRYIGFEKSAVFASPDGGIAHAQLHLGPAVVGLSSAHHVPGNPWSDVRQGIYVRAVFPEIHNRLGAAALTLLKNAFGLRSLLEVPGPGGAVHHAELALGDGIFMMGSGPGDEGATQV